MPTAVHGNPSQSYTERHLPHGITQCNLPLNTDLRFPPQHQLSEPVHNCGFMILSADSDLFQY